MSINCTCFPWPNWRSRTNKKGISTNTNAQQTLVQNLPSTQNQTGNVAASRANPLTQDTLNLQTKKLQRRTHFESQPSLTDQDVVDVKTIGDNLDDLGILDQAKSKSPIPFEYGSTEPGSTPLHEAIAGNGLDTDLRKVERLLNTWQCLSMLNAKDDAGFTPLHLAALLPVSAEDAGPIIKLLLIHGAEASDPKVLEAAITSNLVVNQDVLQPLLENWHGDKKTILNKEYRFPRQQGRMTPLFYAITQKDDKLAALLLHHGALVDKGNETGLSPLGKALRLLQPNPKMVKLLVDNGANLTSLSPEDRETLNALLSESKPSQA